jgi:hypothetical protein
MRKLIVFQANVPGRLLHRQPGRHDLGANIAAAVILLFIALAAVALFFFRRRARDLTLIYFGLLCILYAVRLLAFCPSFRSLFDESRMFWDYVDWVITCTIILPCGLSL